MNALLPQFEIRGIREHLPPGEQVLWQGSPQWLSLAVTAFHVRKIALYFAAMLGLRLVVQMVDGQSLAAAVAGSTGLFAVALAGLGLLMLLAWLSQRTTFYAITSRRVVMRVGIALPIIVNLPLREIQSAGLHVYRDGTGDVPFALGDEVRLAYAVLWPHARRWRFSQPEPMFRAVPDVLEVAQTLSQALAAASGVPVQWNADKQGDAGTRGEKPSANEPELAQPRAAVAA